MTGRLCVANALICGVQTLSRRQSSPGTQTADPRWSRNASSSGLARFFPSVSKCAESRVGQTRQYCSALRIPFHGSGFSGGMKRLAGGRGPVRHAFKNVHAVFRESTDFASSRFRHRCGIRRNDRSSPARHFGTRGMEGCAITSVGKMTELASPAPKAAIPPTRTRRLWAKSVKQPAEFFARDCWSNCLRVLSFARRYLKSHGVT